MKKEKQSTEQRLDEIVNMLNEKLFVPKDSKKSKPKEEAEDEIEEEEEEGGEDLDGDYEEGEPKEHKNKVKINLFSKTYDKLRNLKKK